MPKPIHPLEVLRRPMITEKGTRLGSENKYVFEVNRGSNKPQIKEAVEKAFDVNVLHVNVINVRGKSKIRRGRRTTRRPDWRKAVVTLAPDDKIELFEGL
ncbi:MAG: 50S ribosomal protein L23 [Chloroflexi bacterium]|nr:50S ribosomal protein L23 [Chloroflexota bacterium]MCH8920002.1 50S ribosomal protein L23 [Chloroflexota bacterium]